MECKKPIKQVIIVRKDLRMRKGKAIAQGAHASMKVLLDYGQWEPYSVSSSEKRYCLNVRKNSPIGEWLNGSFTKICVSCESEKELLDCYEQAKKANLPCSLIIDEGRTEFGGIPTKTAVAIGPWYGSEIDKITGNLKLL